MKKTINNKGIATNAVVLIVAGTKRRYCNVNYSMHIAQKTFSSLLDSTNEKISMKRLVTF